MKTFILILGISALSLILSCSDNSISSKSFQVTMNLQGNFNQDSITIFLDNQQIFSKQVTTNNLLGLADVVAPISKESGSHQLKIEMNGISTAENFNLQSALYVGINFNPTTKKFELIYSKEPFLYD